ncbi:hypothetical protein BD410DRAFT_808933 [Rickenella mellea]|uniref:Uncharacterized protein n=1 Tax=Rickenella mellea TaxID=50990 RepID=A0A4Y7PIV5_9AGAM|nr:hypothetical protein BD410DRAFT_808933 [Rickenella mellea]
MQNETPSPKFVPENSKLRRGGVNGITNRRQEAPSAEGLQTSGTAPKVTSKVATPDSTKPVRAPAPSPALVETGVKPHSEGGEKKVALSTPPTVVATQSAGIKPKRSIWGEVAERIVNNEESTRQTYLEGGEKEVRVVGTVSYGSYQRGVIAPRHAGSYSNIRGREAKFVVCHVNVLDGAGRVTIAKSQ